MGHRGVGLFPDLHGTLNGIQTRSPPASAEGFYFSSTLLKQRRMHAAACLRQPRPQLGE